MRFLFQSLDPDSCTTHARDWHFAGVFLSKCNGIFVTNIKFLRFDYNYNRQLEARKIAVSGFLLILQNFKVLGGMPSSQSASQSFASSSSQVTFIINIYLYCYSPIFKNILNCGYKLLQDKVQTFLHFQCSKITQAKPKYYLYPWIGWLLQGLK